MTTWAEPDQDFKDGEDARWTRETGRTAKRHHIMKLRFSIVAMFIVTFGCSDNPVASDSEPLVFPLQMGNSWKYSSAYFEFDFDPRYWQGNLDTIWSDLSIEVLGSKTLLDSIETFEIYERWTLPYDRLVSAAEGDFAESYVYLSNSVDGLYLHGYATTLPVLFKGRTRGEGTAITARFPIGSFSPSAPFATDSIKFFLPPRKVLKYPVAIGSDWSYSDVPRRIAKKITTKERVRVPAGEFDCYKVDFTFPQDSIFLTDYLSSIGLVKRDILIENQTFVTDTFVPGVFDTVAVFDLRLVYELTSFDD